MGAYASAGQQYAATSDLLFVISGAALSHPSISDTATQNAALLRASEEIDGYLRPQYVLPLAAWGSDIVQKTCDIAAYRLVCLRGFNPENESDKIYLKNYELAIGWLKDVAQGRIGPDVVDASPSAVPGQPAQVGAPVAYSPQVINSTGGQTRGAGSR